MSESKTRKSFRLSQEAIDILDKQDNQTEFIEKLILNADLLEKPEYTPEYINTVLERIEKLLTRDLYIPICEATKEACDPFSTFCKKENKSFPQSNITCEGLRWISQKLP